jgi:hypothetical protein
VGFFATSGILNRNGFFAGGFDPDASAFFATAGVTDQTARGQINAFVLGIKNLNLYNNMACWPLRSTQNAGTGTTAYSLGGLGTFNGTLIGGSSWGTSGIVLDGTSGAMTTNYIQPNGNASFSFVGKMSTTVTRGHIAYSMDDLTNRRMNLYFSEAFSQKNVFEGNLSGVYTNRIAIDNTATQDFQCIQASHDGASFYAQANANAIQSTAGSGTMQGTGPSLVLGRRSINAAPAYMNGIISFAYAIQSSSINSNFTNFYNLYKTTLGTGLGLPLLLLTLLLSSCSPKKTDNTGLPNYDMMQAAEDAGKAK